MAVLKAGTRLKSQVDDTQVIVVRAPDADVELTCGGHPLVDVKSDIDASLIIVAEHADGSPLGKRFTDGEAATMEILVTKAGAGSLAAGSTLLVLKDAKPLPSSD